LFFPGIRARFKLNGKGPYGSHHKREREKTQPRIGEFVVIGLFVSRYLLGYLFPPYRHALLCREKPMARGIPFDIIDGIELSL
jgi:hypothetical protein